MIKSQINLHQKDSISLFVLIISFCFQRGFINAVSASLIAQPNYKNSHDKTRLNLIHLADMVAGYDAEFILKVRNGCMEVFLPLINSLWPSDAIWGHRTGLTLAQVMACCLTASSHYLNQC